MPYPTDYDKAINPLTGQPLSQGQYVAYGTSPTTGELTSPIYSNVNMPVNELPIQPIPATSPSYASSYPNIERSTLPPINIPNVARPVAPTENPAGLPLSETQLMERRQAMRGEGMSVARRKQVLGQIASEGAQANAGVSTQRQKEEAQAELDKLMMAKGYTGPGATLKKELKGMDIAGKKDIQSMKQTADMAKVAYQEAQRTGRQDLIIAARDRWQQAEFDHESELAMQKGLIIGSPQWVDSLKAKATEIGLKDQGQVNRLIYSKGMDAIANQVRNFAIDQPEADKRIDALRDTLRGGTPKGTPDTSQIKPNVPTATTTKGKVPKLGKQEFERASAILENKSLVEKMSYADWVLMDAAVKQYKAELLGKTE